MILNSSHDFGKVFNEPWEPVLSMAYQPQIDGQSKCIIQTLEDMLRACVMDFRGNWEDSLMSIEFSYNNSCHSNIGMVHFEALYRRKCKSPLY